MMEITNIALIIAAVATLISILPENADKSKNVIGGSVICGGILIFINKEDSKIITSELIKWDVIILIIFLTIFVDILDDLGYFDYIGIYLVKLTRGNLKYLFVSFGVMMYLMSAFLDNVTAIILLSSLTITVCKRINISPKPFLIYEVFITGVGALLTPVGSVPNIILNSGAHISFIDWMLYLGPFSIVAFIVSTIYFYLLFRKQLNVNLPDAKKEEIDYLDPNQVIRSRKDIFLSSSLILLLVLSFIIAEFLHVGIEVMAVGVSVITMFLTKTKSSHVYAKIDWNTLFFFTGLFIVVGSLSLSGALLPLSSVMADLLQTNPSLLLLFILILGGLISTGFNNIPISLIITSILVSISSQQVVGDSIWYASSIATNIGASMTPIGSIVVIIAFEALKKSNYEIKLGDYFKKVFPLFIIISILGWLYLTLLISLKILP
ncbi:MAG: SLC13 family permease [Candidatus Heimdallarchaeota archaeon]|nr:SLC13 family permease [Candidatus Heimdallarchaeota archaeon]MDH5645938.1 SLC13 family permease [Candidatus Heimdallarchaeota archaeon]